MRVGTGCGGRSGCCGWVWCGLTQRVILIRFLWYILRVASVILYRCFCVPLTGADLGAGGGGAGGGGEVVPVVPGGADTPPLDGICWDDKGVWNAEIFFRV